MLIRTIILAVILYSVSGVAIARDFLALRPDIDDQLPELPGNGGDDNNWEFDVTESGAELAYASASEKWHAQFEPGWGVSSSFHLSHAFRLSDRLGAATFVSSEHGSAQVLINSIYAYKKSTRIRVAAAQRRSWTDDEAGMPIEQLSYLIGAKKYWNGPWRAGAGIRLYRIRAHTVANGPSALIRDNDDGHTSLLADNDLMNGTTKGIAIDFGFRPLPNGRFEFQYELNNTVHRFANLVADSQLYKVARTAYQQHLGNCMQVSTSFTGGGVAAQIEVKISRNNWSIRAQRNFEDEPSSSLLIAYRIAAGKSENGGSSCDLPDQERKFDSIVEAAERSPAQLLYEPLATATQ